MPDNRQVNTPDPELRVEEWSGSTTSTRKSARVETTQGAQRPEEPKEKPKRPPERENPSRQPLFGPFLKT